MKNFSPDVCDMPSSSFVKSGEPVMLSRAMADVLESKKGTLNRVSSESIDKIQRMVESYLINSKERSLSKNKRKHILKILGDLRCAIDDVKINDISRTY